MHILFLTHRLPYAPNRGDRIRAYHMIRALTQQHAVHLVSLVHDDDEQRQVAGLASLVTSVHVARVHRWRNAARVVAALARGTPLTHTLLDAPEIQPILAKLVRQHAPELVVAYCSGMARFAVESPLAGIPLIFDMVDVDSEKWAALAERSSGPLRWVYQREAHHLQRFEAHAASRALTTTVINERERSCLERIAPLANVHVLSNGIDIMHFRSPDPPAVGARVVFTGVFNYPPNEQGAIWMAERVWPLVRAVRPDAQLLLVGANPTRTVRRLADTDRSIVVTGTVPDVRPYLRQAALGVVPLSTARGLQNKALEAIAAGLPVVVTSRVREGLPSCVDAACLVADDDRTFADAVVGLLARSPNERRDLARQADLSALDWGTQLEPLLGFIDATRKETRAKTA
jgi:sugar transferase (PEP-CTERM/EpsH1 system associated)